MTQPYHYVYLLRSQKDSRFYTGYTDDLRKRLARHNAGQVPATKGRLPLDLIFYEAFADKYDAIRREKYLKTTKGKQTLRRMLKEQLRSL